MFMKTLKISQKTLRRMKMARGYEQMNNLNLQISHHDFYAETEGEMKVYEMVHEKTEGQAFNQ